MEFLVETPPIILPARAEKGQGMDVRAKIFRPQYKLESQPILLGKFYLKGLK